MGKLRRKRCDGTQCRNTTFFPQAARSPVGADPFFKSATSPEGPTLQKQDAPTTEEEKKDPLTEGLKTTGEQLVKHEPFKKWYEPKLDHLKLTLWDNASPADKAAMLTFLGVNLGLAGAAFATSPQLRQSLSDVNIGKPLGLIPYSPVEGFKYKLPEPGRTATGVSADFTLDPYLEALQKRRPGFPLTGATFGLESSYDPAGKGFSFTGGKFGLDFFNGALKAEGKTFNELSPYPLLHRSDTPGEPASWTLQQYPGMPMIQRPGAQFMINADLMKLFPWLQKNF